MVDESVRQSQQQGLYRNVGEHFQYRAARAAHDLVLLDRDDEFVRRGQFPGSVVHTQPPLVFAGSAAVALAERACEVDRMHARNRGQFGQLDAFGKTIVQQFTRAAQPRRTSASAQRLLTREASQQLQRQVASLAAARRLLALWHTIHIPIGMALFTAAFIHIVAAIYFATLLR